MEKQKPKKSLELNRQVIRQLRSAQLAAVDGGTITCPAGPESNCPHLF